MMKLFYLVIILNLISEFDLRAQSEVDRNDIYTCKEPGGYSLGDTDIVYWGDSEIDYTRRVYTYVSQWPQFPDLEAYREFSKKDIRFSNPTTITTEENKTRIIVGFIVEKDGSLTNVKILKSTIPFYDQDAIKVVSNMPKWIPGKNNGVAVRCRHKVSIIYPPSQENPPSK